MRWGAPATVAALLTKAAELDPEAWAAPLPTRLQARRLASVRRAKAAIFAAAKRSNVDL